jgi:WD40 repeat protein
LYVFFLSFFLLFFYFYFLAADKTIKIFSISSLKLEKVLSTSELGHTFGVNDCDWFAGDAQLVSCSDDKTVKLWDVETGKCIQTFLGHKGYVFTVRQHPFTGLILSGSFDTHVRLWDPRQQFHVFSSGNTDESMKNNSGNKIRALNSRNNVYSFDIMNVNPNSHAFITSSSSVLTAHADAVVALDVNVSNQASGREFASGSLDGTVSFCNYIFLYAF